jgi:hypothetical protein
MIESVNGVLGDGAARQVFVAALDRYASVARTDVDTWWDANASVILLPSLGMFGQAQLVDDTKSVAALLSRVSEALDLLDETPTGTLYYPYTALTLAEMAADALLVGRCRADLSKLWEYSKRFAGHVDWQLHKSRIFTAGEKTFESLERLLWLRNSRLTGDDDAEFAAYFAASRSLADRYVEAIRAAFVSNSSADYVVIAEASHIEGISESGDWPPEGGTDQLRWKIGGDPIYVAESSPLNSVNLRSAEFLYIWCRRPEVVAEFLSEHVQPPAWVDPRQPDGMVIEIEGFLLDPVESCAVWQ